MECSPPCTAALPSSFFKKILPTSIGSVNQLHRRHLHAPSSSSHHLRFQRSSDSSFTRPSAETARFNIHHRLTCAAAAAAAASDSDSHSSSDAAAIILNVGGMMCEGCASSVKRILESQPQVSSATVDLAAQIAVIQPLSEATEGGGVPNPNHLLGETLAKHLTNCGFASNLRG